MKRDSIRCLCVMLWCCTAAVCSATAFEQPYQAIAKRNAFNLKPVPEPSPPNMPAPPAPTFKLSGIATFDSKRAFLTMQLPTRPGERGQDRWISLKEGEREGDIEVLKIDEKLGTVDIRWSGRELTLKFE